MGRGLSDLQVTALVLALANREAEGRDSETYGGADVYHAEILHRHFGWPLKSGRPRYQARDGGHHRSRGGQNFDMRAIGPARYRSGHASLTRAMDRLEERGLASRAEGAYSRWAGINLTEAGIEKARELSVNTVQSCPSVNR